MKENEFQNLVVLYNKYTLFYEPITTNTRLLIVVYTNKKLKDSQLRLTGTISHDGVTGDGFHGVGDWSFRTGAPLPSLLCRHHPGQLLPPLRPWGTCCAPPLRRRHRRGFVVSFLWVLVQLAFRCADAYRIRVDGALPEVLWDHHFLPCVWLPHWMVSFFHSAFLVMFRSVFASYFKLSEFGQRMGKRKLVA